MLLVREAAVQRLRCIGQFGAGFGPRVALHSNGPQPTFTVNAAKVRIDPSLPNFGSAANVSYHGSGKKRSAGSWIVNGVRGCIKRGFLQERQKEVFWVRCKRYERTKMEI